MTFSEDEIADRIEAWAKDPAVPYEDKKAFFAHFDKVGTLDEKGIQIIQDSLQRLAEQSEKAVKQTEDDISLVKSVLKNEENIGPNSLTRHILDQAKDDMMHLAQSFNAQMHRMGVTEEEKAELKKKLTD